MDTLGRPRPNQDFLDNATSQTSARSCSTPFFSFHSCPHRLRQIFLATRPASLPTASSFNSTLHLPTTLDVFYCFHPFTLRPSSRLASCLLLPLPSLFRFFRPFVSPGLLGPASLTRATFPFSLVVSQSFSCPSPYLTHPLPSPLLWPSPPPTPLIAPLPLHLQTPLLVLPPLAFIASLDSRPLRRL